MVQNFFTVVAGSARLKTVAVMHCKAHHNGDHNIIENRKADLAAKEAARRVPEDLQGMLVSRTKASLNPPEYSTKEIQLAENQKVNELVTEGSQMHVRGEGWVRQYLLSLTCCPLYIEMYRSNYQFHWMFRYIYSDLDIRC